MAAPEDRIPPAVEDHLTERAGPADGGSGATRRTTVEERIGRATGGTDQVWRRLDELYPRRAVLPREDGVGERFAVPAGRDGRPIVVDLEATAVTTGGVDLVLRAYGRERRFGLRPTRRIADEVWAAIAR